MKSTFTCEQSKNCSSKTIEWPMRLLFLYLAIIASFSVNAQLTIDGNPIDWTNFTSVYPTHAYKADPNSSGDNQFTQGSKDGDLISGLRWSDGQTNNKGDISNAGAILTVEGGHNILYFCGDRVVNNGAADIGFWFYKNPVGLIEGGTFGPGAHANGDLLVLTNFTLGGAQPNFAIHVWQGVTATSAGSLGPALTNLAGVTGKTNLAAATSAVPAGFTYHVSTYPEGDFFEGRIDMNTALPGVAPCFNSFLLETRNSPVVNASLQDLAAGFFSQTVAGPTAVYIEPTCTENTFKVQITNPEVGNTYTLTQTDGNVVVIGPYASGSLIFTGLHIGQGYSIVSTSAGGCTSGPTVCVP